MKNVFPVEKYTAEIIESTSLLEYISLTQHLDCKNILKISEFVLLALRHFYAHLPLPQDHREGGRYSYLSSSPQDTVDIGHKVTLKHTQTQINLEINVILQQKLSTKNEQSSAAAIVELLSSSFHVVDWSVLWINSHKHQPSMVVKEVMKQLLNVSSLIKQNVC